MPGIDTETRDHWWWRPGWRQGRSGYTWHFLPDDQPALHEYAARVQADLAGTGVLDPVPIRWLHLTTQGVGFADEVSADDLAAITAAVRERVAGFGPISLMLGPAVAGAEGVYLPALPGEEVDEVRRAVRAGIAQVWGPERVPEHAEGFHPHVGLAYANTTGVPLDPIRHLLHRNQQVIPVTFSRITLIEINRDERVYQWKTLHTAPLTGAPSSG